MSEEKQPAAPERKRGENGVATREEFRAAARAERARRSEVIELPSGLKARLVKPTLQELIIHDGQLPQSVAAKIYPGSSEMLTAQDMLALSRKTVNLVRFVFIDPKVPDELVPGIDIAVSDVDYALQWARGEVASDGSNLGAFRLRASGAIPAAGPGGESMEPAAERTPEWKPEGVPN